MMPSFTLVALLVGGCVADAEPSVPCGALQVDDPELQFLSRSDVVLALGERDRNRLMVLRTCGDQGCSEAPEASLRAEQLDLQTQPQQIVLTATGGWLGYTDGTRLRKVDLDAAPGQHGEVVVFDPAVSSERPLELVGTLRSGAWLVFRNDDRAHAVDLSDPDDDLPFTAVHEPFVLGHNLNPADADVDLRVVALGDRNLVARNPVSDTDELYVVRVAAAAESGAPGEAIYLGEGDFQQVLITRGPSPASSTGLDSEDPVAHDPTDALVVATSGQGRDAVTYVWRVEDGVLLDAFPGSINTANAAQEQVAGLSGVSPDGSKLAYVTPAGSVALRDLETQGACLVRSGRTGRAAVAGFAGDGTVYFETRQSDGEGSRFRQVFAYDSASRELGPLSADDQSQSLKAVPALARQQRKPWALTVRNGFWAVYGAQRAQPLGVDPTEVTFLPRAGKAMWMVEASDSDSDVAQAGLALRLRRMEPRPSTDGAIRVEATQPLVVHGDEVTSFERIYGENRELCLAATRAGAWRSDCTTARERRPLLEVGLPDSERPGGDPESGPTD